MAANKKQVKIIFGVAIVATVALLSVVWFVGRVDNVWIGAVAQQLSTHINDGLAVLCGLWLLGYGAWRNRKMAKFALKVYLPFLLIVQISKIYGDEFGYGHWADRPSGGPGGFPSGHTAQAFTLAFIMSYFYPRWCWLYFTLAVLISWSRVEVNQHSALQVTVAVIAACLWCGGQLWYEIKNRVSS